MRISKIVLVGAIALSCAACNALFGIDKDYVDSSGGGSVGEGGATGGGGNGGVGGEPSTTSSGGAGGGSGGGLADGEPCTDNEQCASEACPADDGICCNVQCNGVCQACLAAKNGAVTGICSEVPDYQDPESECNAGNACGGGACKNLDGEMCNSDANCISNDCSGGTC